MPVRLLDLRVFKELPVRLAFREYKELMESKAPLEPKV
jgi:hypothetical protein